MRKSSVRTTPFVFVQKENETPYIFREGRRLLDPAAEILEGFSERYLEDSSKTKRRSVSAPKTVFLTEDYQPILR